MPKTFHNDIFDKGLDEITAAATAATLKLVLCSQQPLTLADASTLYDGAANKYRLSDEIAVAIGDVTLADKAGGGREITIAAKAGTIAATFNTLLDSGTATSGAATTLTDTGKSWTTNAYTNKRVKITGGTGSGQEKIISSNTATVITVDSAWTTNPDATSTYEIVEDLHYALYDNTRLLYTSDESSNQAVTLSNPVNFPSFKFGMGDPV